MPWAWVPGCSLTWKQEVAPCGGLPRPTAELQQPGLTLDSFVTMQTANKCLPLLDVHEEM